MKKSSSFIGRIVSIHSEIFATAVKRARLSTATIENRFLVTKFDLKRKKLVCFGSGLRLLVACNEVIFV